MDLKSPTFLIVAGVAVFAAVILMRNQNNTSNNNIQTPGTTSVGTTPASTDVNPQGGSYTYMDGSGAQHIIAMDPYGNLVGYSNLPPGTSQPQSSQLATFAGSMSGQYLVSPYGYYTPSYATPPSQ